MKILQPAIALVIASPATVRDLWSRKDLGLFTNDFSRETSIQSAGIYRISPKP